MELAYTLETTKGFDEAVDGIEKLSQEKGFRVLHIHDVQATLSEKGFSRGPFKIIEICNARFAHQALEATEDVGLFLPCKINVFTKNGKTIISAMRPRIISEFFDDPRLKQIAEEVDGIIKSIADGAK